MALYDYLAFCSGASVPLVTTALLTAGQIMLGRIGIDHLPVKSVLSIGFLAASGWTAIASGSGSAWAWGLVAGTSFVFVTSKLLVNQLMALDNPLVNLLLIFRMALDNKVVNKSYWKRASNHVQDNRRHKKWRAEALHKLSENG